MRNYLINIIHRAMETRLCASHLNWDTLDVIDAFNAVEDYSLCIRTYPMYALVLLAIVLPPLVYLANKRQI